MTRGEKRKTGDAATCTIDYIPLLICRSPIGNFRQNFSRQIFFPHAMETKMVATWRAARSISTPHGWGASSS